MSTDEITDGGASPLCGRTVWLVGASSGIGAATAQRLADRGARVAISARREDELEQVSAGRMTTVPLDVTSLEACRTAYATVRDAMSVPDLVLYCAGYWQQTPKGTFDAAAFAPHVAVNLTGLGHVLDVTVPDLVERGSGTIAGVASVAGYRGVPGGEYYGATKAAQINLLEALRGSLRPRGVDVVTICPGFVETEMTETNDFPMPFIISAGQAARDIVEGLERGSQEIVFPRRMAVTMKLARLLPVRAWTRLVAR